MIEAVLCDADGVIQRRPDGWRRDLGTALGFDGDSDQFLVDLFVEEIPALVCGIGISEGLSRVLGRWSCRASLEESASDMDHDPRRTEHSGDHRPLEVLWHPLFPRQQPGDIQG
jgi:hypothetical protein